MISKTLLCVCIAVLVGWLLGFGDYRKIWREKNDLVYSLVSQIKKFYRTSQTIEYRSVDERNQNKEDILRIFTKPELFKYKGVNGGPIYLAIFGQVYDVSKGRRHYGPGGAYSFFSGIDGSRAFVTGDFTEEGLTDDIESLMSSQLADLSNWMLYYNENYKLLGYLAGQFYDSNGQPTKVLKKIKYEIKEFRNKQKILKAAENLLPPCNTEWKPSGSRVWCSKNSGGISRNWVGVPRQHVKPGSVSPTCVCVRTMERNDYQKFKEYKGCDPFSISCKILSE